MKLFKYKQKPYKATAAPNTRVQTRHFAWTPTVVDGYWIWLEFYNARWVFAQSNAGYYTWYIEKQTTSKMDLPYKDAFL